MEDMAEPYNAILARFQILLQDVDFSVFLGQQELFVHAIPILMQMAIRLHNMHKG